MVVVGRKDQIVLLGDFLCTVEALGEGGNAGCPH